MSSIITDIDGNAFVLSGDIAAIQNNRRAKSNFESIGASFTNDGKITLAFNANEEASKDTLYQQIEKLFDKFNIEHKKTSNAESFLRDITQRKEDFAEFAKKAKNIRNNEHESESQDFVNFTNAMLRNLQRNLYTPQLLSAYHLSFAQNACNFSVPGAGKTSIVYAAYAHLKSYPSSSRKRVNRMLIICPLAAFAPWEDEYKECFGSKPSIKKLVGVSARDRSNHFISQTRTEITLISYQSATSDVEYIKSYLQLHNDVMVVLDEAHKIKNTNEGAKWATAIKSIANDAKARVVLTGTPAPNGYEDLWNLYKFIWPHNDIIQFPLHYLAKLNPADKEKLIERISPFFIRIKKSDLDLPEPIYNEPISVPMDNQQREIYEHIEAKYVAYFEKHLSDGSFIDKLKKGKIVRLRQCATNPNLLKKPLLEYQEEGMLGIDDRGILQSIVDYQPYPNKFIEVGNLVEQISQKHGADGKTIIWAYFVDNIKSLETYLDGRDIKCRTLYGATPNENDETEEYVETRESIIRDFHKNDCPYKVIIANPFAVGESISLHKACHNAIYLEKDFNATHYMQSKDRIHRYGLKSSDKINYYFLLSEDSIEQSIHDCVLKKENAMLEIIERDEIPLLEKNMNDSDDGVDENVIRAIIDDYHARKSAQTA